MENEIPRPKNEEVEPDGKLIARCQHRNIENKSVPHSFDGKTVSEKADPMMPWLLHNTAIE